MLVASAVAGARLDAALDRVLADPDLGAGKDDDCLIVELDADPADDVDFDADRGAMLVIPRRIVGCAAIDRELARRVEERTGGGPG